MQNLSKVLLGILIIVASFVLGRYSVEESVTIAKTSNETKEKNSQAEKDKTVTTKKTEVKAPDGTVTTNTEIVETTQTRKNMEVNTTKKATDDVEKVRANDRLTISAMVGADPFNLNQGLQFGVSVTKPFFGPFVLGVWALPALKVGGIHLGFQY